MSQIRLYLDEDLMRKALKQGLRSADIDVVTTLEAGNLSFKDEDQLAWAAAEGRVIYSFNVRDFTRLHTEFLAQNQVSCRNCRCSLSKLLYRSAIAGLIKLDSISVRRGDDRQSAISWCFSLTLPQHLSLFKTMQTLTDIGTLIVRTPGTSKKLQDS